MNRFARGAAARRAAMVLPSIALAGCASGGASAGPGAAGNTSAPIARPAQQSVGSAATGRINVASRSDGPIETTIAAPIERVWRALPAAFDSLAIPVSRSEPATHTLGNDSFKTRQRLGKTILSRYFDCGATQIGPNADSYEVNITLLTSLSPAGDGSTRLATSIQALARPITFNQGYSACSSKGELERRIVEQVTKGIGGA